MKTTTRSFSNCIVAIITLLVIFSFSACSADTDAIIDNEPPKAAENPFNLVVKALSSGEDITTKGDVKTATLFVFDENNDFFQQINLDESTLLQRKAIEISCPKSSKITVIGWGGLSGKNEEVSAMSNASIISDLQIQLKQNNGIANASDLFYGQVTLQRPSTKANKGTLTIARKVSSLSLVIKGVNKKYGTTEGSYFFKVKKTKCSFNHKGELTGEDVEYIFPAYFDKNEVLVAETTPIFPASEVSVELYRDNEVIFSTENAKNGEKVSANEGKQTNVVFNFSKSSYEIAVSPWKSVVQYVTID